MQMIFGTLPGLFVVNFSQLYLSFWIEIGGPESCRDQNLCLQS